MADATQELMIRIRGDSREAQEAFIGVTRAGEETQQALKRVAQGSGGAASAIQGLSRFTNDAISFQYGFQQGLIAVANQTDQLVYALGQMREASRATGATIRSQLLAALAGPNGVLLAVNAIVTAVAILGPRLAAAFDEGSAAADRARESFADALDELVKFQSASRTFTFQNQQQAEAGARAAREEANAIFGTYSALQREQEQLLARLRPGGPGGGVLGVTPEQSARLAELPGLIAAQRDEWNEVARVAARAQQIAARYNAEARVAARAGQFGFPETPERVRSGGRGAAAGRGGRGGAPDRESISLYSDVRERVVDWQEAQARLNASLAAYAQTQVGASIAAGEYAAAVRAVGEVVPATIERVTAMQVALAEGIQSAQLAGTLTLVNGLSDALGDLAALDLSGFAEGIERTMRDVVRSVASAIAQALLLRAVLAGLNLISPGLGSGLGSILGVAVGGNAVAAPANLAVTFGGASYREGGIYIPASVVAAATRDHANRQAGRGRTR